MKLLKRYDTQQKFFDIAYDRVSQLKSKYNKNEVKFGTIIKT